MTQADKIRQEAVEQYQKSDVPLQFSRLIGVEVGTADTAPGRTGQA